MSEPSLDEVLSGAEPKAEPTVEKVEEPEPPKGEETEPKADEPKAEAPEEQKAEAKEEPPSSDTPEPGHVPLAAMLDEREKRQAAQREVERLRAQQPDKPKSDPVENPDAFRQEVLQEVYMLRHQEQLEDMREQHADFDQAWEWADAAVGTNAFLAQQIQGSRNIPRAVYKAWEDHQKLQKVGEMDAVMAENAELKAQIAALQQPENQTKETPKAPEKPSLATVATSTPSSTPGDVSLEDLVGADALSRPK